MRAIANVNSACSGAITTITVVPTIKASVLVGIPRAQVPFNYQAFLRQGDPAEFRPHGKSFGCHGLGYSIAQGVGQLDGVIAGNGGLDVTTEARHSEKMEGD
jgi:hypothetical protein